MQNQNNQKLVLQEISKKMIVLISTQRSGTNLLRSLLMSTGNLIDFKEVFHNNITKHNFFRFRRDIFNKNPHLSIPTPENIRHLFNQYIKYLAVQANNNSFIIDIKYNSFCHLSPCWQSPLQKPFLLNIIQENEMKIIHLIRDNVLETECSMQVLHKNKKACYTHEENPKYMSIRLNTDKIVEQLKYRQKEISFFQNYLDKYKNSCTIKYSEIAKGSLSDEVRERLYQCLGLIITGNTKTPYKKIAGSKKEMIENYDEVVDVLNTNELSYLLDD